MVRERNHLSGHLHRLRIRLRFERRPSRITPKWHQEKEEREIFHAGTLKRKRRRGDPAPPAQDSRAENGTPGS